MAASADATVTAEDLHLPAAIAGDGTDPVVVTPERAGWDYAGLRVVELAPGGTRRWETGPEECAVLPLAGSCVIACADDRFDLDGRRSPFAGPTDFVYLPRGSHVCMASERGGRFALPSAPARRTLRPFRVPAEVVAVEKRGAGAATRTLHNFLAPEVGGVDRLTAVEVITPAGNWSSYPPHKHDVERAEEACLEEIYYFEFAVAGGEVDTTGTAYGLHRTYDLDRGWDVAVTVRTGDVFLVPSGYHGPCAAAPGYDMYYLNVLAGPGDERSLAYSDDPRQHWIRESWASEDTT